MRSSIFLFVFFILTLMSTAHANSGIYEFPTEEQRQSFQLLTEELRCPKCQNQNLADSNSEISDIMRDVIAESINAGKSEQEIKQTMVDRYGDFVLYKPPVTAETIGLWWAPGVFLVIAAIVFISIVIKRKKLNIQE